MRSTSASPQRVGRYLVGGVVASGGMAVVHLGQVQGAAGFTRTVAIKRMLPHFSSDPDFASMFFDEARLAARVRHPNVVPTLDVVMEGGELCIVMEYVQGATLAQLAKLAGEPIPTGVAIAIVRDALQGLHAAHEAVDAQGRPLGIVHRDVSPQNILVGTDGVARVLDFGIAKANVRLHQTREGSGLKGKLAYMAPEQLDGSPVDRASDVFAASVVLWETLTGERLYAGANEGEVINKLLHTTPPSPSAACAALGTDYDAVVLRGLAREPGARFGTARAMAVALGEAGEIASAARVGEWVERIAAKPLAEREARVRELETMMQREDDPAAASAPREHDPDATRPATPASVVLTGGPSGELATMAGVASEAPPRSRKGLIVAIAAACLFAAVALAAGFASRASEGASQAAAGSAATIATAAATTATAPASATASAAASAVASTPSASTAAAPRPSTTPPPKARPALPRPPPTSIPDHL